MSVIQFGPGSTVPGSRLLRTQQILPGSPEEVFDFFADAGNLQKITPDWLRFRILTPLPIPMSDGTRIDYRISLHGIPVQWKTEITDWNPPSRFVDRQLRGPYRLWRHTHTFEAIAEQNQTRMTDSVEYIVPGGRLIDRLFVQPDLKRIFSYRRHRLEQLFDDESGLPRNDSDCGCNAAVP